ncbi:peptidase domain-containing ABC transporter [Sneathiella sp.]|uniref:peptidase domain-containing ABC transporter n=1 Tax=Sneathiella sp. TaxID=1964365 RepID=UPI0039E51636
MKIDISNDDKPMLRQASLPKSTQTRLDIILASTALNILALALPIMILQIYDRIIPNNATDTLLLLVLGVGLALILEAFFRLGRSYITAYSGAKFDHIAGCRALSHAMGTDIVRFEKEAAGVYLHRFNAIENLKDFMSGNNLLVFIDLPFGIIFLFMVGYIGGVLVLAPILLLLVFAVLTVFMGSGLKKALDERSTWDDRRYNFLIEVLTGIHTVKGLALEAQMVRRYERLQETTAGVIKKVAFQNGVAQSFGSVFSQITLISVAAFGSVLVINEALTIGGLAACTLLSGRALQPLLRAMGVWTHYQNIKLSKKRVNSLLSLPQEKESRDSFANSETVLNFQMLPKSEIGGRLAFEQVSFGYGGDEADLFQDMDAQFFSGSTTAIAGPNGSGKTTLLWLAMGLIAPTQGRVLLNGEDMAYLPKEEIHNRIAYLPQNGTIFHGTIMENLTMFRKGSSIDRAISLSIGLGLDDTIKRLPLGYDTIVGDGAADSLPGGIRQRIAIARALVNEPEIILFDEANTSLDAAGDEILKNAMFQLKGKSTIILVSHRPSLLKIADQGYKITRKQLQKMPVDSLTDYKKPAPAFRPKIKLV